MLSLPKPSRPRFAVVLAVLIVAGGLAAFAVPRWLGEKTPVLTVSQGELRQSVVASGKVRSPQRVELASQISGRVARIPVREGDLVTAGQLLIEIDDAEWRANAAQARATLAQSETRRQQMAQLALPLAEHAQRQADANLTQAQQHFTRTRELVDKGFYSKTQLDDAQRNLDVAASQQQAARLQVRSNASGGSDERLAQSAIDQARASLDVAQARLAYARIVAPVAGTVLSRSIEPGDTAQPGKVLMTLSPSGVTELIVQIDEKNLGLLHLGQPALASADAYPGENFAAAVSFISPVVDALRGSVEVRLRVPAPPAYLRQEMTVSIDIETARKAQALRLPSAALHESSGAKPWVLVVRDGVAEQQTVELGLRSNGQVEILAGLNAGDAVIPAARLSIRPGSRIRPVSD